MKKIFKKSIENIKRPLRHVKKVKHIRWLLPGWVFYEFYNLHKGNRKLGIKHGAKAEAIRLAATASIPIPGTYELTTTGLAIIKKKIQDGEIENLTLKSFRDFMPLKVNKEELKKNMFTIPERKPYLKIFERGKKLYFKIFYKNREK